MNDFSQEVNLDNVIVFGGNAKPPQGIPIFEAYRLIGCIIYVDKTTHCIVDASFTTVNELTNRILKHLLIGHDLKTGIASVTSKIEDRLHLVAKKAFVKAVESCYQRYIDYCSKI